MSRVDARPDRIFRLNPLIDLPSTLPTGGYEGGEDAELYFLDFDPYVDRSKTTGCLVRLAREVSARRLDLATKTLLLAARGLYPLGRELMTLLHDFRTHHVFFELWNGDNELAELLEGGVENLYFMPVTTVPKAPELDRSPRVPASPNGRVFVSLGGDDDLDLIGVVVARCPRLSFFVPTVRWVKGEDDAKRFLEVRIPGANVTPVDCSAVLRAQRESLTPAYRSAYRDCDTVLIAPHPARRRQMRGGVRLVDALQARKHMVVVDNPMCELVMARAGETCLTAAPDAGSVAQQLERICSGGFQVDESRYEEIRSLTFPDHKLPWMIAAARQPDRARRSVFGCGRERLEREVARGAGLTPAAGSPAPGTSPAAGPAAPAPLATLFDLAVGKDVLAAGGASFVVRSIVAEAGDAYRVELVPRESGVALAVRVVTSATGAFAYRTRRGHYLVCLSSGLTGPAREALKRIAELC